MSDLQVLEAEIKRLCDEARTMLSTPHIESVPAVELVVALRECARHALGFGLIGGESQLQQAADDLDVRVRHECK